MKEKYQKLIKNLEPFVICSPFSCIDRNKKLFGRAIKPEMIIDPLALSSQNFIESIFKMDEISDILGREMNAETFEVNTSTHYGRMVRIDDNTVILFGDMDEMMEYI